MSRKNALQPAVDSLVAVELRLGHALALQLLAAAAAATSRISSIGPNWIDSVGHALAQAGSRLFCSRS